MREHNKNNVVLEKVPFPEEEYIDKKILDDATIQERLKKVLRIMGEKELDCLVIYADVEHGSNFEYLCGFIPRFEEALLVLHKNAKAYLLLGNEVLGMAKNSRIQAEGIHVPYFSLPDQPMIKESTVSVALKKAGLKAGMQVGIVGWKGLYRYDEQAYDVPHYIVEAVREQKVTICNATGVFIDSEYGARAVNCVDEIAFYEYGQVLAANGTLRVMKEIAEGKSEVEMADLLESDGQFHNVVTIFSTGASLKKPIFNPSSKK